MHYASTMFWNAHLFDSHAEIIAQTKIQKEAESAFLIWLTKIKIAQQISAQLKVNRRAIRHAK